MRVLRAVAILSSCVALACSSANPADEADDEADAGGSGAAGSGEGVDGGAATSLAVTGNFALELVPEAPATADQAAKAPFTKLLGQALDGMTPQSPVWTMTAEEGGCQLFEPSLPFCNPSCTNATVCVAEDVCAGYPRGIDLGAVTLRAVRVEAGGDSIVMKPVPPKYSYQLPGSPSLSYPPFAPGDEVTLETEGGELPAFSIRAPGFTPLQLLGDVDLDFSADAPTELRWEPAPGEGARIRVVVDISHHGGRKGELRCETEDKGAFDIPASLSAALIELGLAGNPTLEVIRASSGSVAVAAGRVGLSLESPVVRRLRIPGLVTCEPDLPDACPEGQVCEPVAHRCQ